MNTWVWVGQIQIDSKSPTKNPHPWPGFGGFFWVPDYQSHLPTSHPPTITTTTDATICPEQNMSPEHDNGKVGGDEKCRTQALLSNEDGNGPSSLFP